MLRLKPICFAALFAVAAHAQSSLASRVLVVVNSGDGESKKVASYYMEKRGIPAANRCSIESSSTDQIKQDEFDAHVKPAIRKCLDRVGRDNILYIVFTYKTPWLLEMGPQTNALDTFVADIWDAYLPERAAAVSEMQPYFGQAQPEGGLYQAFVPLASYRTSPGAKTIYSVWRLDAPNAELAKGLVDKALEAEAHGLKGNACFDLRVDPPTSVPDYGYGSGEWEIHQAAQLARRAGFNVIEDGHSEEFGTAPAPLRCDNAALYAGWYALNHYNDAFSWNPGAIGIHLDSASATNPRGGDNWATHALARGITITAGATTEPYLQNLPHPDEILWCLFHGANAGDALLRSERLLKWRIINIGDPLYRPFPDFAELAERIRPPIILALAPQGVPADSKSSAILALPHRVSAPLTFAVKVDHPDLASVPATVTVEAGIDGVKFPIETKHTPPGASTVRITVTSGELQCSNTLIVVGPPAPAAPAKPAPR